MTPERANLLERLTTLTEIIGRTSKKVVANPHGPIWRPDIEQIVNDLRGFADAIDRENQIKVPAWPSGHGAD